MKFVAAFVVVVFLLASVVAIDIENQEAETIAVDNHDQSPGATVLSPKSAPSSTNRLATNGYASFYGQFPHHAEFYNHVAGNGLFYGSLITANYVLTGAYSLYIHFVNNNFDGGSVVLGSQNRGTEIREQRINFTASGINLHPFYEYGSNLYDIATVRLEHGATLNQYVQPIRLPSLSDSRNYDLMEGATFARLYDGSQRYVRNKVMTNIDCNLEHPFLMIYAQHICTDSYIGATNGYASFYGQFPHHAEIYNDLAGDGMCYGSLITANYVLTGAYSLYIHFVNNNFDGGSVVLGSQNRGTEIREQKISFTASGINLHPFYEYGSNLYDIATVRLEHGATLNQYVQPIRLPSLSDSRNYDLMEGATFARLYDGSQRYVRNKVMTNIDCNLEHPFLMIYAQHICTDSYIGGAFCHRNSGAALTIEDERGRVQIGITRWMNQCDYNYPNIHVRVSTFRDWISANSDYINGTFVVLSCVAIFAIGVIAAHDDAGESQMRATEVFNLNLSALLKDREPRIEESNRLSTDGYAAFPGQFPYHARVYITSASDTSTSISAGSLITANYILTSAFSLYVKLKNNIGVHGYTILGSPYENDAARQQRINFNEAGIKIHPLYADSGLYNIGTIRVVAIDVVNQEDEKIAVHNHDQSRGAKVLSPKSAPSSTNRLATNGYVSFNGQFPHHAEIYNDLIIDGMCYGSLITPNYVLTTAYWLFFYFIKNHYKGGFVVLGSPNLGTELREQKISFSGSTINIHPSYEYGSILYDIATVRLGHAATLNQYVQPIRLPSLSDARNYDLMEGATFARLNDGSQRYVRNKVMTNTDCNLEHPLHNMYAQHICTDSYIGGAFCHRGDGAALIIEDEKGRVQIGITRWMNDVLLNDSTSSVSSLNLSALSNDTEPRLEESNRLSTDGYAAFPGQFPYHARLNITSASSYVTSNTGGSLITANYILTTASSLYTRLRYEIGVHGYTILGSPYEEDAARQQRINFNEAGIAIHPLHADSGLYNIGTIRLEHPAILDQYVYPIRLPSLSDARTYDMMEGTSPGAIEGGQLRYSRNQVMSNADCIREHPTVLVYAQHICTDTFIGGAFCLRELSAALVVEDEKGPIQIGITTRDYGCSSNNPTLFTRVSDFRDWISMNSDYVFNF
uniref:Peptidase S1 domain-containing protein n=1 Tax=Anopheles dirus TaxID=7168 RepID=A0A182NHP9_9DIPT